MFLSKVNLFQYAFLFIFISMQLISSEENKDETTNMNVPKYEESKENKTSSTENEISINIKNKLNQLKEKSLNFCNKNYKSIIYATSISLGTYLLYLISTTLIAIRNKASLSAIFLPFNLYSEMSFFLI